MRIYRIPPTSSKVQHALALAEVGLTPVLLYPERKVPVGRTWHENATRVPWLIIDRWGFLPEGNVGVCTGERDNLHVLDIDVKDGARGLETARRLLGPNWWERYTYVRTPSGGYHIYFYYVPAWGNRKLGKYGLDVQGDGAQVVAPGMLYEGQGEYSLPLGYLEVHTAGPELLAAMEELYSEARVQDMAGEVVELDPNWQTTDVPELGPYLTNNPNVRAFLSTGNASRWNGDESTAVFAAAVAMAAMERGDRTGWLLSPAQALRILVENRYTLAVAQKDSRRSESVASAAQWLYRYNIVKAFGGRGESTWGDIHDLSQSNSTDGAGALEAQPFDPFGVHAGPGPGGGDADAPAGLDPFAGGPDGPLEPATDAPGPHGALVSVGGVGGGVDSPGGSAAVAVDTHPGLKAEIEDLPGRADILEQAQGILYRACAVELSEIYLDDLVQDLSALGMQRGMLRRLLTRFQKQVAEERRAARLSEAKVGEPHYLKDYVFVPGHGFINLLSGRYLTLSDFRARHGSEAYDSFVEQGLGRKVEDITFLPQNPWAPTFMGRQPVVPDPAGRGVFVCNVWMPPPCRPALDLGRPVNELDVAPWLELPGKAGVPADEARELVLTLAYKAQHPGHKVNRIVLLGGDQGTGKSLFLTPLYDVFGRTGGVRQVRQNVLESEFDPDISEACVMVIEEVASQARSSKREGREAYNKLKPYGAAPPAFLSVVLKGKNAVDIPNQVLVCGTSNYDDCVVIDQDDRRWSMTWWESTNAHTRAWGRELYDWLTEPQPGYNGHTGSELVAAYLLQLDVSEFDPGAPPLRSAWWHQCREDSLSDTAKALRWVMADKPDLGPVVTLERITMEVNAVLLEKFQARGTTSENAVSRAVREAGYKCKRVLTDAGISRGARRTVVVLDGKRVQGLPGHEIWALAVEGGA